MSNSCLQLFLRVYALTQPECKYRRDWLYRLTFKFLVHLAIQSYYIKSLKCNMLKIFLRIIILVEKYNWIYLNVNKYKNQIFISTCKFTLFVNSQKFTNKFMNHLWYILLKYFFEFHKIVLFKIKRKKKKEIVTIHEITPFPQN